MLSNRKWNKFSHPLLQFVIEYYYHGIEGDKIGRIFKAFRRVPRYATPCVRYNNKCNKETTFALLGNILYMNRTVAL